MPIAYTRRVDLALQLVAEAFRPILRKRTTIPYLSHLMAVAVTVMEAGGDEEQVCAALLHDYLEDVEGSDPDELERLFGPRVRRIVVALSDTTLHPKPPWAPRKVAFLSRLAASSGDVKLVCVADKLHNARSIERDRRAEGEEVWSRFSATKAASLWYYRATIEALETDWAHPLVDELRQVVDGLHRGSGVEWTERSLGCQPPG